MKLQFLFPLVLFFVSSCSNSHVQVSIIDSKCDIEIEQTFLTDSIIQKFRLELKDENIRENFSPMIESTIKILENFKTNENAIFPYQRVDSASYYDYEPYEPIDEKVFIYELKKRKPKSIIILCGKKTKAIIHLFNNPNYFMYAECGTAIPEAEIKLFNSGRVIGRIEFACDRRQTSCEPFNKLNKFGGLNEVGYRLLDEIAPWE